MDNKKNVFIGVGVVLLCVLSLLAGKQLGGNKAATIQEFNGGTIVSIAYGNMDGDGVLDTAIAYGKQEDGPLVSDIDVSVIFGGNGTVVDAGLQGFTGYDPHISSNDFTGDGVDEVFLTLNTGGSGDYSQSAVLTYADGKATNIWNAQNDQGLPITGSFIDGFKAQIDAIGQMPAFTVDISKNKQTYIDAGVYDQQGKLLKATPLTTSPYVFMSPWGDGAVSALWGVQTIKGINEADHITDIYSTLVYGEGKWQIISLAYGTFFE